MGDKGDMLTIRCDDSSLAVQVWTCDDDDDDHDHTHHDSEEEDEERTDARQADRKYKKWTR